MLVLETGNLEMAEKHIRGMIRNVQAGREKRDVSGEAQSFVDFKTNLSPAGADKNVKVPDHNLKFPIESVAKVPEKTATMKRGPPHPWETLADARTDRLFSTAGLLQSAIKLIIDVIRHKFIQMEPYAFLIWQAFRHLKAHPNYIINICIRKQSLPAEAFKIFYSIKIVINEF